MKLYFNENFEIIKRDEEDIYRGSERFNHLRVYFPRTEFFKYYAIYPIFSYKRSDGREGGDIAFTQSSAEDAEWYEWYDVLPRKALEINGVLQITIAFKSVKNEGDVIIKTVTGKSLLTIKDAVVSDTDIIYTDTAENTVKSMTSQIDAARVSIESLKATYNAFDLGAVDSDPYSIANTKLNAIIEKGVYKFVHDQLAYLMLVEVDENSVNQTLIYSEGINAIWSFNRTKFNNTWSLSQKVKLATNNDITALDTKLTNVFKTFDLGEIGVEPTSATNSVLNAVTGIGVYRFKYLSISYLMYVNLNSSGYTFQVVMYHANNGFMQTFNRFKTSSGWTIGGINTLAIEPKVEQRLWELKSELNTNINNVSNDLDALETALKSGAIRVAYAKQASEDAVGNVIDETYATKTSVDAIGGDLEALEDGVRGGAIRVAYAKQAEKDGKGNIISDTYTTKTELDEVKETLNNVINNAPEAYDTLKEIADYIASDVTGASNMLVSINKNKDDIASQEKRIEALENEEDTNVSVSIKNIIVPNDRYLNSIYMNKYLSQKEVVSLLNDFFGEGDSVQLYYVVLTSSGYSLTIMRMRANQYTIGDSVTGQFFNNTDEAIANGYTNGWLSDDTPHIVSISGTAVSERNGNPVANRNDELTELFSLTSFRVDNDVVDLNILVNGSVAVGKAVTDQFGKVINETYVTKEDFANAIVGALGGDY